MSYGFREAAYPQKLERARLIASNDFLFSVRPPKKSWKNISNLSGGEKTLSSLALVRQYVMTC